MRNKRHEAILNLIQTQNIETQQDLTVALSSVGFDVTQATVSRDIKELGLIKKLNSDGNYIYARNSTPDNDGVSEKMAVIFSQSVISASFAQNIIVLKTLSGMAQGAAAALDSMNHPEILGTIAGDDTIFIVAGSEESASRFCRKLEAMIG